MTNEFTRFLIDSGELNAMASIKRLLSPAADLSLDSVYAPFAGVPSERIISPEILGITDPLTVQVRIDQGIIPSPHSRKFIVFQCAH